MYVGSYICIKSAKIIEIIFLYFPLPPYLSSTTNMYILFTKCFINVPTNRLGYFLAFGNSFSLFPMHSKLGLEKQILCPLY